MFVGSLNGYVSVLDVSGQEISRHSVSDSAIKQHVCLDEDQRNNSEETDKSVEVGLEHPLLSSKLTLIDCPGIGENANITKVAMSNLCQHKCICVLYVIDGKKGFTLQVRVMFLQLEHEICV